jgi:hypothetical protein
MSALLSIAAVLALVGPAQVPDPEARAYAALLSRRVVEGRVDYRGLAADDLPALDRYLAAVARAPLPEAREARIAFHADAYNALVLRSVIAHGRPRSVLDVKGFFDRDLHTVAGRRLTLDALEKQVLLPFAREPRLHFVLVCGAVGCPILDARPLSGSALEPRLAEAARRFLAGPTGARVQPGELRLSRLFDWYAADFGGPAGVLTFARAHLPPHEAARLGERPRLAFLDYNWTLNQQ